MTFAPSLQVYSLKSCHVPQSKLHDKLVQATRVIISLVREKEVLTNQLTGCPTVGALTNQLRGHLTVGGLNKHTQTDISSQDTSNKARDIPLHDSVNSPRGIPSHDSNINKARDLPSVDTLQFSDDSSLLCRESLDEVLKMVDLTDSDSPRHTSTPTEVRTPNQRPHPRESKLELIGHKAPNTGRPIPKSKGQSTRQPTVRSRQQRVRNYNIKHDLL